ncbi:alpha-2-macroglobulin family protein [Bacteroides sp.]|uniref:alpha-2-macroglobulin family protein n=1 Tax=Bacteroides sp. TaxID=29523 RepID=UPI0025B87BCE|nr:alpha-2-macroglobulin family protein [Bacteroides sp.]
MKKSCFLMGLMLMLIVFPITLEAQNYDKQWKEVEALQKKDLPRLVIEKSENIFLQAVADRNLPQMIKAFMVCSEYKVRLSPDSLNAQKEILKEWAASESDAVGKAVLNSIMATVYASETPLKVDPVISCLRLSLQEKDLLASRSAVLFYPVVISNDLSKEYFDDNMYDFLARQAVRTLLSVPVRENEKKIHNEILGIYDSLIALYSDAESPYRDKKAEALTREARLVYLSDNCVYPKDKLSSDEAIKEFKKLASEYQDIDVYCDITLKLAQKYNQLRERVEAMSEIRKALELYPETRWTEDLKKLENNILAPSLRVEIPFVYPGYRTDIKVSYNNITSVTIEAYRLNLPPTTDKLGRNRDSEQIIKKYGTRVAVNNYTLPPTADYKVRNTQLKYKLPDSGIYMLKLYSKQKEDVVCYEVVYISPYQCVMVNLPDNMVEMVALERMTGHPVPKAEIVSYIRRDGKYEVKNIYQTDVNGTVEIARDKDKFVCYSVRTSGNDFMKPVSVYSGGFYANNDNNDITKHTKIFTDRSIYRPGQKVFVSGVVYMQDGDSISVSNDSEVNVSLLDANRKTVENVKVQTDEFGVYSAEFVLKPNAMPGMYSVKAGEQYETIRVEEYKRPTFDVVFSKMEDAFSFGDSVRADAKAATFAGSPLRMAKVEYKVLRQDIEWFRFYRNEKELISGETMTDADGRFHVDFHLLKPESGNLSANFICSRFRVMATVTSLSGETQSGEYVFSVGGESLSFNISGLPDKLAKERIGDIKFEVLNYDGIPVETNVRYEIYKLGGERNTVGKPVFSSEVQSRKPFVPYALSSLPSGSYRLKVSTADSKERETSHTQDFVLFSLSDSVPPFDTAWWFYQDGESFANDGKVDFYVGSSEEDAYLMLDVFTSEKRIESKRITFSNSIRKFRYSYKKEYGDGITVCLSLVRNGELYRETIQLAKPEPDKKLLIEWKTFRDKLVPGQTEEWKLTVRDKSGNPVKASMLASAYDASLDEFYPHGWYFSTYFRRNFIPVRFQTIAGDRRLNMNVPYDYYSAGNGIDFFRGDGFTCFMPFCFNYYGTQRDIMAKASIPVGFAASRNSVTLNYIEPEVAADETVKVTDGASSPALRENFSETAFYYPRLHTDSTGTVTLSFVMPDALTKWNFNGFVHTKDMDYGLVKASFTTSKPFMVQPNMPRFVRVDDDSSLSSSLINMSDGNISGKVTMTISNPFSGKVVYSVTKDFNVREGETGVVTFNYKVTEGIDVLVCTIMAEAGEFSDGERHYLPVLSDKQLIVENIPVQLRGDESKTVDTGKLFNGGSQTATNKRLTVEMTANPQWHVIQALPVLGTPSSDDAMSWAAALYANSLSLHIVKSNPKIKQVFDTWVLQGKGDKDFWSELSKNEELKNIIIEETPWLAEAEDEAARKQRIALLFDVNGMNDRLSVAVTNLAQLQLEDGSWPWFKGMSSSPYITLQIVQSLARLKSLGITFGSQMNNVYLKAIGYLAKVAAEWHSRVIKNKNTYWPQYMIMHYLYVCAIDKDAARQADAKVNSYFTDYFMGKSASLDIQDKSVMATVMDAAGKKNEAKVLLQSIMEYMVSNEEMGSYFDTYKAGYSWCNYRIPAHVSAMEAIMRLGENKEALLDDMRLWLLKQKQVQVWDTPVSSVNAIYAFLADGGSRLDSTSVMTANVGGETITTPDDAIGQVSVSLCGDEINNVKAVTVSRKGSGTGWASVYTQCLESMDKVKLYDGDGLRIERKYMSGDREIDRESVLSVGDKVTVSITVSADRDMDFVRIKDEKPACLEAASQLSSYSWSGGLGYYRVNKDASVEFFVDSIRKGTYTITYDAYVTRSGNYVSGPASVISVYASQFGSHSEGFAITVR